MNEDHTEKVPSDKDNNNNELVNFPSDKDNNNNELAHYPSDNAENASSDSVVNTQKKKLRIVNKNITNKPADPPAENVTQTPKKKLRIINQPIQDSVNNLDTRSKMFETRKQEIIMKVIQEMGPKLLADIRAFEEAANAIGITPEIMKDYNSRHNNN